MILKLEIAVELVVKEVLDVLQLLDLLEEFVLFVFVRKNVQDIDHELLDLLNVSSQTKDA